MKYRIVETYEGFVAQERRFGFWRDLCGKSSGPYASPDDTERVIRRHVRIRTFKKRIIPFEGVERS